MRDCKRFDYEPADADSDDTESDDEARAHGVILQREARLMMVLSLLALVAAPWTTGRPPMLLYVVYLPILVHSKWIECSLWV